MSTMTPAEAAAAIRTAHADKEKAEQTAAALEERVLNGDQDVTAAQLAEAHQAVRFAELRITAAERKHAAAQDAARHETARTVAEQAVTLVKNDDAGELADAMRNAVAAIGRLCTIGQQRHDLITGLGAELTAITDQLGGDFRIMRERYGVAGDREQVIVYNPRTVARTVPPAVLLAAAVHLGAHSSGLAHAVGEALAVPEHRVQQVFTAVPTLAEQAHDTARQPTAEDAPASTAA
ncbi:hypothetical protein ACH4C6_14845 [Streptomyces sp. NPDC017943]|uniref:hypothetical protein n=1 Tax=Streptomyces sp. NPDC017943 TaxID=3365019 RepID=UPI00378CC8D5